MISFSNNKDKHKDFCKIKSTKDEKKLDPETQQTILETTSVSRVQNRISYLNQFVLRRFRLRLVMEEAA